MRLPSIICLLAATSSLLPGTDADLDVYVGQWWKEFLSSRSGNKWFDSWNKVMQAKFDELVEIAEAENKEKPFRILMVGDSTMKHQFGSMCGFLGEREGHRFNSAERQTGNQGCCIDTAEGGGRGLCFEYDEYRFLNPAHAATKVVDAFYFGCGLHLFHAAPERALEPLRTQEWLAYEALLVDQVNAIRATNGEDVRIMFMTTHVIDDTKYRGSFAEMRDAYRVGEGNNAIRAACESQVEYASNGSITDFHYWEGRFDLSAYTKIGEGRFNVSTYCSEGLLDGYSSIQLNTRARPVMARLGVPLVDAAQIVQAQKWATHSLDGRHYHPIVPMEVITFLDVLTAPMPPRLHSNQAARAILTGEGGEHGSHDSHDSPHMELCGSDCHNR